MKYTVLFEDNFLIAVNKPSGLLVIPTPKNEKNTLTSLLNERPSMPDSSPGLHPCHRLDRETSGVIIYAKGKKMQRLMMDEFKKRAVKKLYIAFIHGFLKRPRGCIARPIFNYNKKRLEEAVTNYNVIESRNDFSIVEVKPLTGRTNQIRIHFKEIGHPIVGESVYAFRKDYKLKFKRTALHAESIQFKHPATGHIIRIKAPLPEDMKNFLNKAQ